MPYTYITGIWEHFGIFKIYNSHVLLKHEVIFCIILDGLEPLSPSNDCGYFSIHQVAALLVQFAPYSCSIRYRPLQVKSNLLHSSLSHYMTLDPKRKSVVGLWHLNYKLNVTNYSVDRWPIPLPIFHCFSHVHIFNNKGSIPKMLYVGQTWVNIHLLIPAHYLYLQTTHNYKSYFHYKQ